jgi:hypothetical protein
MIYTVRYSEMDYAPFWQFKPLNTCLTLCLFTLGLIKLMC